MQALDRYMSYLVPHISVGGQEGECIYTTYVFADKQVKKYSNLLLAKLRLTSSESQH